MGKRCAAEDPAEWAWWLLMEEATTGSGNSQLACRIVPELPENGEPEMFQANGYSYDIRTDGPFDSPYNAVNFIGMELAEKPFDVVAVLVCPLSDNGRYRRPSQTIYDGPVCVVHKFGRKPNRREVAFSGTVIAQMLMLQRGRWPWWEPMSKTVKEYSERYRVADGLQAERPRKKRRKPWEPEGREVKEARQ